MDNIYSETIQRVADGARFSVSLDTKSLKLNGQFIIKDGIYEGNLGLPEVPDTLAEIERLYGQYRHSIPSARSESWRRQYFIALSECELSDEDMMYGIRRDTAQVALELFVLGSILNRDIDWEEIAGNKWFWQSPKHPSLILLKHWII